MKNQIFFERLKDKKIFCYFSDAEADKKRLLIMNHGFRGSNIGPSRTFMDFERVLLKTGISVLRFDQPCSGNSDGDFSGLSFNDWIDSIVYFAEKYLETGWRVGLMGQSMGASASIVAANRQELKGKIPVILLWVHDPKTYIRVSGEAVYEESGQKYYGKFWNEAKESEILSCIREYRGKMHLVYGEKDRYVDKRDIKEVIKIVRRRSNR